MSLKEARENLAKKLSFRIVKGWLQLLDLGHSIAEAFTHTCQPNIAVYEPQKCAEAAALFIEEMRLSSVNVSCLVLGEFDYDLGLCEKYDIQRITPDELSGQDIDFVLLLSEGEEFSELRFDLEGRTGAEVVSLWIIAGLVYDKYFTLKTMVDYLKKTMTKMCALTWPYVHNFDNPDLYKNVLKVIASYAEYQKDPGRFNRLYCDIPEYSGEYIKEILAERPIVIRNGRHEHADCRGKYVNIINGLRLTTGQPDCSDYGVYIYGGCLAYGFGTDDRYTMASALQRHVNSYYGSEYESGCAVYNLGIVGVWGADHKLQRNFAQSDDKTGKVFLYIMRGDTSHSKKKNPRIYAYIENFWREYGVDCIDLTPVLQEVEERLGTYIDAGHVNHRGYIAVAKTLFDYVKPILESWDREAQEALSGSDTSSVARLSLHARHQKLTDSGHSVAKLFAERENVPEIAIYCSESSLDTAVSLAEELKEHSVNMRYFIVPTLNEQVRQMSSGIELVSLDELSSAERADVIITMPDISGGEEKIRTLVKTEVISFNDLVNLVYDRYFYYPELLVPLAERRVNICLVQWPNAVAAGATSDTNRLADIASNIGWYGANLYSDISGFSLSYLEEITAARQAEDLSGEAKHTDCKGKFLNILGGDRVTTAQPKASGRTVFVFGGGVAFGVGAEDKFTIPALLQEQLNALHAQKPDTPVCRVVNKGLWLPEASDEYILTNRILPNFKSGAVKEGDIVILVQDGRYSITEKDKTAYAYLKETLSEYNVNLMDLTYAMQLAQRKGAYIDKKHTNHRGYKAAATKIYFDYVKNVLEGKITIKDRVKAAAAAEKVLPVIEPLNDPDLTDGQNAEFVEYLGYLAHERSDVSGSVGAIVMNCNPFTNGHRYLVEKAAAEVDFLYVFIVEEDRSVFKFEDRFALAREGLKDIKNVKVLRSGKFIISTITFPGYFTKDSAKQVAVDTSLDLRLFVKYIVPALGISIRFVGTEPLCQVTKQYNRAMKAELPKAGVRFVEYDRIEQEGEPISASKVRALLEAGKFEELGRLVPQSTFDYLKKKFG